MSKQPKSIDLIKIGGITKKHTDVLAAKGNRINAANLLNNNNNNKNKLQSDNLLRPPPSLLDSTEAEFRGCKLTRIMLYEEKELDLLVRAAKNCMIEQGVLPINTRDQTDKEIGMGIFDLVLENAAVYKRALIWHILLLCPQFCKFMIEQGVDPEKVDAFINNLDTDATVYQAHYPLDIISTSACFVALVTQRWLEFRVKKE